MNRRRTTGWAAVKSIVPVIAIIVTAPAWASSMDYGKAMATNTKGKQLAAVVVMVQTDLGREIQPTEWPQILTERPTGQDRWNGPYDRLSSSRDAWGREFVLDRRHGAYSVGLDGIDQGSGGDDIASWKPFNRESYRAGVFGTGFGVIELVGGLVLLNLFLIPGWVALYRRRGRLET